MDSKSRYSSESKDYIENDVAINELDAERYERSKRREEKYHENWSNYKVNINDIVNQFVPECSDIYTESGVKLCYENEQYKIEADKVAGYLRIYNKKLKKYVKLDGKPGTNDETHFKIKKKEEM